MVIQANSRVRGSTFVTLLSVHIVFIRIVCLTVALEVKTVLDHQSAESFFFSSLVPDQTSFIQGISAPKRIIEVVLLRRRNW